MALGTLNKIPIYPVFYLLKRDYRVFRYVAYALGIRPMRGGAIPQESQAIFRSGFHKEYYTGGCQNYGPDLDPSYTTAPKI